MWLVRFLLVFFLAVWVGKVVFLSAVAAPVLFSSMPSTREAGDVMTLLFPWYYRLSYVCAAFVLLCSVILARRSDLPRKAWMLSGTIAAAALAASLYAGVVAQPRAHELRQQIRRAPAPHAVQGEFDRLHKLAVQLNGGVLIATLALCGIVATRLR